MCAIHTGSRFGTRGVRVVTNASRDAMDVGSAFDEVRCRGRPNRAGLAPQWQVPSLRDDVPLATGTTKPGLSGVSTQ